MPNAGTVAAADITGNVGGSRLLQQIVANHHLERSGDIYIVPQPHWLPYAGTRARPLTATHGSPWKYDTHVPIVFMGPQIGALRVGREVALTDVAPTISAYLGIAQPEAATGTVLTEITSRR